MGQPALSRRPRNDLARVLAFVAGAIASRLVGATGPRGDITVRGRRLPPLCAFRLVTGHRCPGCGMTRGFLYMFRMEPLNALRANPMSPVVFAITAASVGESAQRLLSRPTPTAGAPPAR